MLDTKGKADLKESFKNQIEASSGRNFYTDDDLLDYLAEKDLDISVLYPDATKEVSTDAEKINAQEKLFKIFYNYCDKLNKPYKQVFDINGPTSVLTTSDIRHDVSIFVPDINPDDVLKDFTDFIDKLFVIFDNIRANQAIPNTEYWEALSKALGGSPSRDDLIAINSALHYWKHGSFKKYYTKDLGEVIKSFDSGNRSYTSGVATPATASVDTLSELTTLTDVSSFNTLKPADDVSSGNIESKLRSIQGDEFFASFAPGWSLHKSSEGMFIIDNLENDQEKKNNMLQAIVSYSGGVETSFSIR